MNDSLTKIAELKLHHGTLILQYKCRIGLKDDLQRAKEYVAQVFAKNIGTEINKIIPSIEEIEESDYGYKEITLSKKLIVLTPEDFEFIVQTRIQEELNKTV